MVHQAAWTSTAWAGISTSFSATTSTQSVSCARVHTFNTLVPRATYAPAVVDLRFNHEDVMKNDIVEAPQGARAPGALLFQTRYVEMFGVLASEAARRGILVMIACHRINKDAWPGKGLWYDEALNFPEKRVVESWSKIAGHLCGHWNVFAADLQNEPHASSWGKGLASDWNKAAERIGDHVLGLCPRWLIMVEGVGFTPGAPGADDPGAGYWWGENIVGAKVAPVRLRDQSKLVCAPMTQTHRPRSLAAQRLMRARAARIESQTHRTFTARACTCSTTLRRRAFPKTCRPCGTNTLHLRRSSGRRS